MEQRQPLAIRAVCCDVLNREVSYIASMSRCRVDTVFLPQGLHDTPDVLRTRIQEEIDRAQEGIPRPYGGGTQYDAVVLGYGLCCNGTARLAARSVPLVIPRGHDCVTLLLGSRARYAAYFSAHPGTFWYSRGWIERANQPSAARYESTWKDYAAKYGEDNADYLMQLEEVWLKDYSNAAFVDWPCLTNAEQYRAFTQEAARYLHWNYDELEGDRGLLERMLNGCFLPEEVLVVPPGHSSLESHDETILQVADSPPRD